MHHASPDMQACIEACQHCAATCLAALANHCVEAGGAHVAPDHVRLMLSCAVVCRTAAEVMLIGSDRHGRVCGVCAEFCAACAESCRSVGDMEDCVKACEACADHCRRMAA